MKKQQEIDKELSSKTQYLCITSKYNQRLYLNSGSFFEENVYRFPERTRRLSTKEQCHGRCLRYKALLRQSRQSWVCFKSWFMAPLKSKACRDDGTLNESFILANIPPFVLQRSAEALTIHRCRVDIESLHEFGLICHKDDNNAAFPPDAIAGVKLESPLWWRRYVALVEMKSKCSEAILSAEMELAG